MSCELCEQRGDVIVQQRDWRVVLVSDAHYPGFCRVIWNHHVKEMTDLTPLERNEFMRVVWEVEAAIRSVMQPHKVNLASLGNVVPHLHWHVIPRYEDDLHFPNPIWGQIERSVNDRIGQHQSLMQELRALIAEKLDPAGSQS